MKNQIFVLLYFIDGILDEVPDAVSDSADKLKQWVADNFNNGEPFDWVDDSDSTYTLNVHGELVYKIVRVVYI